eukprot:9498018-Pyramimonas_sp.AAC.1
MTAMTKTRITTITTVALRRASSCGRSREARSSSRSRAPAASRAAPRAARPPSRPRGWPRQVATS